MNNPITRLNKAPQPTLTDPLAQINWIFFQVQAEKKEITALGIKHAKSTYIRYLAETHAYYPELEINSRFYLDKYWESDALIRFNRWLNDQGMKSKTRYSVYKWVRQVMDMAYALRVIDNIVYHAPMFKGVSETKQRAAYSKREQEVINSALAKWISLAISIAKGYTFSGQGIPYRRVNLINTITIDGNTMSTIEAAEKYGISRAKIQDRLRHGWSDREAVGLERRITPGAVKVEIDGQEYDSFQKAATAYGVSVRQLKTLLRDKSANGLLSDSHLNHGLPKQVSIGGVTYKSIKEATLAHGKHYPTIKNRLNSGWSVNEAFDLDVRDNRIGQKLTIEGVTYNSISKAAEAYGLESTLVSRRLRGGYTPEQAVGLVPIYTDRMDERALLWRFENEYNCDAAAMLHDAKADRHGKFSGISIKRLLPLFVRWGVWPYIDAMVIMPLAVELAMLTGLNVESLKSLDLDSYTPEHPLTGQPAIRYRKPRSGSPNRSEDRELHVPFLEVEELYIDDSVAEKIHIVIDIVIRLTARIRQYAPPEIANRLFIFEVVEKTNAAGYRVIVPIEPAGKAASWRNKFAREEGLRNIFGTQFNFNIARCRPTLATNMVLAGADLFQVQVALGHQSVQTTATYLDELQLQPAFNKTISEALRQISIRSVEITNHRPPDENTECNVPHGFYETLSGCGCMNAYTPSENVRKATQFKEGSVCKYWNMCLLCDNSVITESSLPKLINYRTKISQALTEASPAIKTRTKLFEDTVELIQGILEPGNIFPKEVIDRAHSIATTTDDLLIDQLVYQGF